jgi:hypothetical protein
MDAALEPVRLRRRRPDPARRASGVVMDPRGAVFSAGFTGLWLIAAALFWNAAQAQASQQA